MVTKVLAVVFAAAVLTAGGYTYWQYADGCCGTESVSAQPPAAQPPCPSAEVSPCCLEPTRAARFSTRSGEGCCDDVDFNAPAGPEVLTIQPREVK